MTPGFRSIGLAALACALCAGGWLAYSAAASRPTIIVRDPTVVAVVRLTELSDGLEQHAQIFQDIGALEAEIDQESERRKEEMAVKQDAIDDEVDEARKAALQDEMNMMQLRYGTWYQMAMGQLDIERAVRFDALYKSIRDAARQLAQAEGIDVILFDNSSDSMMPERPDKEVPRFVQVLQSIDNQRLLYARPELDITDQLTQRMNNSFRAGATP